MWDLDCRSSFHSISPDYCNFFRRAFAYSDLMEKQLIIRPERLSQVECDGEDDFYLSEWKVSLLLRDIEGKRVRIVRFVVRYFLRRRVPSPKQHFLRIFARGHTLIELRIVIDKNVRHKPHLVLKGLCICSTIAPKFRYCHLNMIYYQISPFEIFTNLMEWGSLMNDVKTLISHPAYVP
jgi:hypothetical protein